MLNIFKQTKGKQLCLAIHNNMAKVSIIFPHQLFKLNPAIDAERKTYLVEESLFFNQYKFHKQKLVLHRATMKCYEAYLQQNKIDVTYIDATDKLSDIRNLITYLYQQKITEIHVTDTADNWLQKRIYSSCKKYAIKCVEHASPNFINTADEVKSYSTNKKTYFQTRFYTGQRKQRKILLDASGGPEGGQWTYDADNRIKFPKNGKAPVLHFAKEDDYIEDAKKYIENNFRENYGSIENFIYPTDFIGTEKWLDDFFKERFEEFGIYEDAIVANEHFLHHAVLSPILNIGLLQPGQIISKAITAATQYKVPLNSLEGFIRQLLGWREFIRIVYEKKDPHNVLKISGALSAKYLQVFGQAPPVFFR